MTTHIRDDHFEIKLIARLLNQIYVVQPAMLPPRYDDAPLGEYEYSQQSTSISSATPSAPQFPEHLHSLLHALSVFYLAANMSHKYVTRELPIHRF